MGKTRYLSYKMYPLGEKPPSIWELGCAALGVAISSIIMIWLFMTLTSYHTKVFHAPSIYDAPCSPISSVG